MGNNRNPRVIFNCDYCGKKASDRPSHYAKKKRHFCSQKCWSEFQKHLMPIEEHGRFGTGLPNDERIKRRKARIMLNHHLRDKKISRPPCEICGNAKSEAHHDDYDKPLDVRWFCFKHHRQYHKIGTLIYQNPELLNTQP